MFVFNCHGDWQTLSTFSFDSYIRKAFLKNSGVRSLGTFYQVHIYHAAILSPFWHHCGAEEDPPCSGSLVIAPYYQSGTEGMIK